MTEPTPAPPGSNPNNGQIDPAALVGPRPVAVMWNVEAVPFVNGATGDRRFLVEVKFLTATGTNVTYWGLDAGKRLSADLRRALADASRAESGLWVPPAEGNPLLLGTAAPIDEPPDGGN